MNLNVKKIKGYGNYYRLEWDNMALGLNGMAIQYFCRVLHKKSTIILIII